MLHPIKSRYYIPSLTDEEIENIHINDKKYLNGEIKELGRDCNNALIKIIYQSFDLHKLEKLLTPEHVQILNEKGDKITMSVIGRALTMMFISHEFEDIEVVCIMKMFAKLNVLINPWYYSLEYIDNKEKNLLKYSNDNSDRFKWILSSVIRNVSYYPNHKNKRPNLILLYKDLLLETLNKIKEDENNKNDIILAIQFVEETKPIELNSDFNLIEEEMSLNE